MQNLTTGGNGQSAHKGTRCILFLTIACGSIIISIKFSIKKESTSLQLPLGPSWFGQQFCSPCLSRSCSPTAVIGLLHFSTAYGPAQPCGLNHCQPSSPLLHCAWKQKQLHPLKFLLAFAPSKLPLIHKLLSPALHVAKPVPALKVKSPLNLIATQGIMSLSTCGQRSPPHCTSEPGPRSRVW